MYLLTNKYAKPFNIMNIITHVRGMCTDVYMNQNEMNDSMKCKVSDLARVTKVDD